MLDTLIEKGHGKKLPREAAIAMVMTLNDWFQVVKGLVADGGGFDSWESGAKG